MKYVAEPMPFEPESFDAMKARWRAAVSERYELAAIESGQQMAPAFQRRHVFDFHDGVRVIVSMEKTGGRLRPASCTCRSAFIRTFTPTGYRVAAKLGSAIVARWWNRFKWPV